jgi:hypothetical protein
MMLLDFLLDFLFDKQSCHCGALTHILVGDIFLLLLFLQNLLFIIKDIFSVR